MQQRQNQKHLCMESMNIALIRCTCFSTSAPAPVPNHNKRFACLSFKECCCVFVSGCERTSKATCGRRTVRRKLWLATSLLPTPRQSCLLRTHMIFGIDRICSSLTRSLPELFLAWTVRQISVFSLPGYGLDYYKTKANYSKHRTTTSVLKLKKIISVNFWELNSFIISWGLPTLMWPLLA